MKRYFVTATGTDTGKTFVTCAMAWQLRQQGKRVSTLKPIASGVDESNISASDAGQLLAATGKPLSALDEVCPWRFRAPLSPDMAATLEGKRFRFDELVAFCNQPVEADIQFIEGVGGVMSPVSADKTMLDWIKALAIPVVLVTGSYVGTISHTLTALQTLQLRALPIHAIILNESAGSAAGMEQTLASLKAHMDSETPVYTCNRVDYGNEMWKYAPPLTKGLL